MHRSFQINVLNRQPQLLTSWLKAVEDITVLCCSYSEVVEGGVRQAASGDVFGQLIQHLRVLSLRRTKNHTIIRDETPARRRNTVRCRKRNWHAWPGCCGEWALCAAGCWNATSLFSSCHRTWTPGTDGPPHTPEETSRVTPQKHPSELGLHNKSKLSHD